MINPEVTQILGDFKFRGQGQKKTPVTDVRGAVELVLLLPGRYAAQVRRQAADLIVRYMGGDPYKGLDVEFTKYKGLSPWVRRHPYFYDAGRLPMNP